MGVLFTNGKFQAFDEDGLPLVGGKLNTYASKTTTPKDTYSDKDLTTPNANPVILDGRGEADVWMATGDYKFILHDSADNLIWSADEIESDFELSIITTKGDIIQGGNANDPERLPIGAEGEVLKVVSGKLDYASAENPVSLTNKSGDLRIKGDVLITDPSNNSAATITTTQGDTHPVVVVYDDTIAANAEGQFYQHGIATVAVQGNVTRGNYLRTSTTEAKAEDAGANPYIDGVFAIALTGYAGGGAGTVIALLLGKTETAAIPIGLISPYGGASAPLGWLLCQGAAVSRATYAALFAIIGTAFGVGDGSTTFNLPNLQQRFPLGKAASGTGSTLGGVGGAIDHVHAGLDHLHKWYEQNSALITDQSFNNAGNLVNIVAAATKNAGISCLGPEEAVAYPDQDYYTNKPGVDNTGAQNPSFQAVNFIIKY